MFAIAQSSYFCPYCSPFAACCRVPSKFIYFSIGVVTAAFRLCKYIYFNNVDTYRLGEPPFLHCACSCLYPLFLVLHFVFFFCLSFIITVIMNGSCASLPSASFSFLNSPLYSVMENIFIYSQYLDPGDFGMMRILGDQPSIYDR